MSLSKLETENEIRHLVACYSDGIFRKDWNAVGEAWASDGVWHAFGERQQGRENIVGWVSRLMELFRFTWHHAHGGVIDVNGDTAASRHYVTEITCDMKDEKRLALGIYHDRYKIENGRWRFAVRHWSLMYLGPTDMSARLWDLPSFGPPPHDPDIERPNVPSLQELQRELGL